MESEPVTKSLTWRTTHGDMTDEEWELMADLVAPYSGTSEMSGV